MTIRDRRALKNSAKNALEYSAYSPRKLFGIHIAVTAGITLVLSVLTYCLDQGIAATGGLDGIGPRALLQTAQQLLQTLSSLATPFWQISLFFLSLQLFRRQTVDPSTLLTGFRRAGPVLRLFILKIVILFAVVMGSTYVTSILLSFSPLSDALSVLILSRLPAIEAVTAEEILVLLEDPVFLRQFLTAFLPMFILLLVVMFVCLMLILYRLRMTDFVLMDQPEKGARHAIKTSWRLTKGNCFSLFKLDLSFWWFYTLDLVLMALYMCGFLLLETAQPELMQLLFDLVFCIGQVALYTWANAYVQTTYAAAYEVLLVQKRQQEQETQRQTAQTQTPWGLPQPPQI